MSRILVTGAGGMIGSHLVNRLKQEGHFVKGVDVKYPEYNNSNADEFVIGDLTNPITCVKAVRDVNYVYHLAALLGGMPYISGKDAHILKYSGLIDINMIDAAYNEGVAGYLYCGSACMYNKELQTFDVTKLKEDTIFPAMPDDDGYSWEKIFGYLLCKYHYENYGMNTHTIVFHSIYGPNCCYNNGREKAPAAICRKVIESTNVVDIIGTGKQIRSFCYIDDAIEGMIRLMNSDYHKPLNCGSDRAISIEDFTKMIIKLSGKDLKINYIEGPTGVSGRNSDNTLCNKILGWEPSTPLEVGIKKTYDWIGSQINK